MKRKKTTLFLGMLLLSSCGNLNSSEENTITTGSSTAASYCQATKITAGLSLSELYDKSGNTIDDSEVNSSAVAWTILDSSKHAGFSGVGRYGNCTGTLIDTGSDDGPAYVLTNGHCIGSSLMSAKGVLVDVAESKNFTLNYYVDAIANSQTLAYQSTKVKYATMENTDFALVELNASLKQIKSSGYCAYKISANKAATGENIYVVGVPLTGVKTVGLRYSSCSVGDYVSLAEGSYRFTNSFRHRCSIVPGNSGSPVFDASTLAIVGVVNTTVEDSAINKENCALSKPCEVASDGSITTNTADNYGQIVSGLATCFTSTGVFDLSLSTCTLPH